MTLGNVRASTPSLRYGKTQVHGHFAPSLQLHSGKESVLSCSGWLAAASLQSSGSTWRHAGSAREAGLPWDRWGLATARDSSDEVQNKQIDQHACSKSICTLSVRKVLTEKMGVGDAVLLSLDT